MLVIPPLRRSMSLRSVCAIMQPCPPPPKKTPSIIIHQHSLLIGFCTPITGFFANAVSQIKPNWKSKRTGLFGQSNSWVGSPAPEIEAGEVTCPN